MQGTRKYCFIFFNLLKPRVPVSYYVENVLLENIETEDPIKQYGPFLSYVNTSENIIHINDWKQQRIAGVRVQANKDGSFSLFCELGKTDNCVHVGFALALPQFYRMLGERAQKKAELITAAASYIIFDMQNRHSLSIQQSQVILSIFLMMSANYK
ncbi:MAG: hypothetical protein JRN26_07790 [Nitrososphaerota archaeon]|nr:hypothetical protein [Nitrososphaerota archaeon]MDG6927282.1 hypothetical protein [Nitrososphaerota archaeon]MDG6930360.1 hypothetical protein [Nitrososphaerota archaeon]MDG6931716.1 hypothetical protein [Nitrososphaerota archaeon]MDG6936764.1 hypothetical protein [Nitrososphaerota archaeon]